MFGPRRYRHNSRLIVEQDETAVLHSFISSATVTLGCLFPVQMSDSSCLEIFLFCCGQLCKVKLFCVSILSSFHDMFVILLLTNDLGDFVFFSQLLNLCHVGANKQTLAWAQSQYYYYITTYTWTKKVKDCNLLISQ